MVKVVRFPSLALFTAWVLCPMLVSCHPASNAQANTGTAGLQQFLPNAQYTPGAVLSVTMSDVCTPDYARNARDVPIEEKEAVYREYGIMHHGPHQYEVDHLIPLEIGGSNDEKNLWPQPMNTQPWNAHVKDKLENRLHDLVCSGRLGMKQAQQMIATNWITAYQQVFHSTLPLSHYPRHRFYNEMSRHAGGGKGYGAYEVRPSVPVAATSAPAAGNSDQVWVNTNSGKFFTSSQRWYGRTRRGTYMSREAALQRGYVAAGGD